MEEAAEKEAAVHLDEENEGKGRQERAKVSIESRGESLENDQRGGVYT